MTVVVILLVIICLLFVLPMLLFGSVFGTLFFAAKKGLNCVKERADAGCELKRDNTQYNTKQVCKSDCHIFEKCDDGFTNIKNNFGQNLCVKEGQICNTPIIDPYANPFVYDENHVCGYNVTNPCKSGYSLQGDVAKSCQIVKTD